jgi:hypothetical protein
MSRLLCVCVAGFYGDIDRAERGAQRFTEAGSGDNDAHADESGDQAVLDCGGARLIVHETCEKVLHNSTPKCCLHDAVGSRPSQ